MFLASTWLANPLTFNEQQNESDQINGKFPSLLSLMFNISITCSAVSVHTASFITVYDFYPLQRLNDVKHR